MKKIAGVVLLSLFLFGLSPSVNAKEIEGVKYEKSINVEGKTLKFIGAGIRVKTIVIVGVNVYTLGAYTESGICDKDKIINTEETKSLVLVMLRKVDANTMATTIGEAFDKQLSDNSPKELRDKRAKFEALFKEPLDKGNKINFDYTPGKGMSISQNGKLLGIIEGSDFAKVFFSIYFGPNNCCPNLLKSIMECGK